MLVYRRCFRLQPVCPLRGLSSRSSLNGPWPTMPLRCLCVRQAGKLRLLPLADRPQAVSFRGKFAGAPTLYRALRELWAMALSRRALHAPYRLRSLQAVALFRFAVATPHCQPAGGRGAVENAAFPLFESLIGLHVPLPPGSPCRSAQKCSCRTLAA